MKVKALEDSAVEAYQNKEWSTVVSLYTEIDHISNQYLNNNMIIAASDSYRELGKLTQHEEVYQFGLSKYGQKVMQEGFGTDVYTIVENPPAPKDGFESFKQYTENEILFPESSLANGVKGYVFLQFIVNRDGSIDGVHVVKGINPECDKEAIRLLTNGPTWSPGTQRGNTVYMMQIQSIEFNSKRYKKRIKKEGR
ncbi:MAG: energy transducer TonB [Ekhidna sp.]|nr:energy transducer TonB [Ekhidna sp.]